MIISHRHGFIFIKTQKTGGTSLEIALSRFCGPDDIITPETPQDEAIRKRLGHCRPQNFKKPVSALQRTDINWIRKRALKPVKRLFQTNRNPKTKPIIGDTPSIWPMRFYNHMPAAEIRKHVDKATWENYYIFSVERNPWDFVVSQFYWRKNQGHRYSFRDFVLDGWAASKRNYEIYAIDGEPAVDNLARYETLMSDLTRISARIGLPEDVGEIMTHIRAKGDKRKTADYRELYDDETREAVARQFEPVLTLMGYTFDGDRPPHVPELARARAPT